MAVLILFTVSANEEEMRLVKSGKDTLHLKENKLKNEGIFISLRRYLQVPMKVPS